MTKVTSRAPVLPSKLDMPFLKTGAFGAVIRIATRDGEAEESITVGPYQQWYAPRDIVACDVQFTKHEPAEDESQGGADPAELSTDGDVTNDE